MNCTLSLFDYKHKNPIDYYQQIIFQLFILIIGANQTKKATATTNQPCGCAQRDVFIFMNYLKLNGIKWAVKLSTFFSGNFIQISNTKSVQNDKIHLEFCINQKEKKYSNNNNSINHKYSTNKGHSKCSFLSSFFPVAIEDLSIEIKSMDKTKEVIELHALSYKMLD